MRVYFVLDLLGRIKAEIIPFTLIHICQTMQLSLIHVLSIFTVINSKTVIKERYSDNFIQNGGDIVDILESDDELWRSISKRSVKVTSESGSDGKFSVQPLNLSSDNEGGSGTTEVSTTTETSTNLETTASSQNTTSGSYTTTESTPNFTTSSNNLSTTTSQQTTSQQTTSQQVSSTNYLSNSILLLLLCFYST